MKVIQFESSTACNARCTFCPREEMKRKHCIMSDELFHKIIKEGKEMKVLFFLPFLNGEPFVFPKIWEWLDYMQAEGVQTAVYTNGEFLDPVRLSKYTNIRYVNCSFNGVSKEAYDKVTRRPDYDKAKKNIEDLIKIAKFPVHVSMVVTEDNMHEVDAFKIKWGGRRAKVRPFLTWAGAKHSSTEKKGIRRPCYMMFQHMTILWDGRVALCCMDHEGKVILGDANKQSLQEIWDSNKHLRDRHKKLDFDMPLCRDCNFNADG
jgi:radical SAM protein with 4Fe4S-binding SPASM domain